MLTIRIDDETAEMLAYLRNHKVNFAPRLKRIITAELTVICQDYGNKVKINKDDPPWLYD